MANPLPPSANFTTAVNQTAAKSAYAAQRLFLASLLGTNGELGTALNTLGALASAILNQTSAYTVTAADRGRIINATSGTWTLSLTAAATLTATFSIILLNSGTGVITINPNGAETINGAATETVMPGASVLLMCNGTNWWGVEIPGTPQKSATDATENAVLRVAADGGAFGIGNLGDLSVISDLDSITIPSGFYAFKDTGITSGSRPADIGSLVWGMVEVQVFDGGTIHQRLWRNIPLTTTNGFYKRAYVSGAWTAWDVTFMRSNLLGTVAQTAGIPTGSVIERGSNANGGYVRFADGTQICTFALAASSGAGVTWTFPAVFAAAPVVQGAAQATVLSCVCLDSAPSTTAAVLSCRDKTDARRADTMHLTATGRWF